MWLTITRPVSRTARMTSFSFSISRRSQTAARALVMIVVPLANHSRCGWLAIIPVLSGYTVHPCLAVITVLSGLYPPSPSGYHPHSVWLIPSIPVWLSSPFCLAIPSTFPAIILILPGLFSSCCRSSSLPLFSLLQFMGAKALIMNVCVCVCVCV